MTVILPFLPLYVQQLGAVGKTTIAQWSGVAYGATFFTAGIIAPFWGHLGDRYGRKPMLLRASLGMTLTMGLMGCVTTVWQLIALRFLAGLAAGYSSGATIMIAAQAPKERSAWALGLLSSGVMAGNLAGPLVGGLFPHLIGIRMTFVGASLLIFVTFLVTVLLVQETPVTQKKAPTSKKKWSEIPNKTLVIVMLSTGMLLMMANMSIEPIITLYIRTFAPASSVTFIAGLVMSAAALGSILSASWLGHLADKIGANRVVIGSLAVAGLLLIPQAFVTSGWQLIALRFLMGIALGGLIPCIIAVVRHNVPNHAVGTVLGYTISAQYAGQVIGPLLGGFMGGHVSMRSVFLITSVLLLVSAFGNWCLSQHRSRSHHS